MKIDYKYSIFLAMIAIFSFMGTRNSGNPLNPVLLIYVLFLCATMIIIQYYDSNRITLLLILFLVLFSGLPLAYALLVEPIYVSTFPFLLFAVFFVIFTPGLIIFYTKRNDFIKENENTKSS